MSVFVIGAGGHAKVVIATLQAAGETVGGVFDDDPARRGTTVLGVPVLGSIASARQADGRLVIAVGANAARKRIAESFDGRTRWATAIHPHAWVHPSAEIGEGNVVCAGAIIQPDAVLGRHVIVNTGASVDHDTTVGSFVHLAPGTRLAGSVTIGEGVFCGIASCAIPGTTIGAWTTVGAGGVVVCDLAAGVTAVGVPARPRSAAPVRPPHDRAAVTPLWSAERR